MEDNKAGTSSNMDMEQMKAKAMNIWQKILAAYKYNPYKVVRETPIVCPKCHTTNLAIAVSCKECGAEFAYRPMKRGVSMGLGLGSGLFLMIASWIVWGCTGSEIGGALWWVSLGGVVGSVASYKMKHWGWKAMSLSALAWECLFMTDKSGPIVGLLGGAIILSPIIYASWLGYKSMVEAGAYLDAIHSAQAGSEGPEGDQKKNNAENKE